MSEKLRNYVVLDYNKFYNDVRDANFNMKDGVSVSRRLVANGMSESTISNSKKQIINIQENIMKL